MADLSKEPPNSRIFILCSKNVTEADLHDAFDQYGNIEDIWIVKDKASNESKGVVYIKFSKASEAALAMEEMNGKVIGNTPKPIKVMIAHSREQGSKRDDDPERLLRLFIVIPKSSNEEDVREHFKQFGELEYLSVVKNRETGESKGIAYVKYYRAYHAAKAYEECSKSYKAVFARPREPKMPASSQYDPPGMDRMGGGGGGWAGYGDNSMSRGGGGGGRGGGGDARLVAMVHSSLRQEQVYRLFDIAPGLIDIRPQANPQMNYYQSQKVLVEYNCPQSASHALEKLQGFEYPMGQRISVRSASGDLPPPRGHSGNANRMDVNGSGGGMTSISTNELATLNAALAKAESIIKNQGLAPSGLKSEDADAFDPTYCSVRLPPPQPLVTPTDGPAFRLFIVCQPGLPSMYALRDIFGRFGNLVEVYTIFGKNCGYVTYATNQSADDAIKTLHLQEVCGMRIKVMVAEPPRGGPDRSDRKRLRVDTESTES